MDEMITAFRFAGRNTPQEHSEAMKKLFAHLYGAGAVTYSQFLFPYVDSLLLSEDSQPHFFGSHALLWEMEPESIMQCAYSFFGSEADILMPQAAEIALSAPVIADFLGETSPVENGVGIGDFSSLLTGMVRPWSIREHSRCLCSFAEHIDRMKGYRALGFSGGRLIAASETGVNERELAALYTSKTGGIAGFIYY